MLRLQFCSVPVKRRWWRKGSCCCSCCCCETPFPHNNEQDEKLIERGCDSVTWGRSIMIMMRPSLRTRPRVVHLCSSCGLYSSRYVKLWSGCTAVCDGQPDRYGTPLLGSSSKRSKIREGTEEVTRSRYPTRPLTLLLCTRKSDSDRYL